ncbi:hypothetical protein D5086_029932 [Populus alba]|uniref:Uncharacterized protein n=1 Tax=Populus alba TaxID=43335 RepID=A0ACC4AM82_POPAL
MEKEVPVGVPKGPCVVRLVMNDSDVITPFQHNFHMSQLWMLDALKAHQSRSTQKSSDDYVDVRRWQAIPLLRSAVAVPLNGSPI